MTEAWAPVADFPGYEVSNDGRVRSRGVVILKPWLNRRGYLVVKLARDQRKHSRTVHRLVLAAFVGPGDGLDACHGNGDRTDNRLANLRYGTRSDNIRDQVEHGTHANAAKTHCLNGHPLTPENTYASAWPERRCVTCARARAAASYEKRKSA